jgi:hypothetical protein
MHNTYSKRKAIRGSAVTFILTRIEEAYCTVT